MQALALRRAVKTRHGRKKNRNKLDQKLPLLLLASVELARFSEMLQVRLISQKQISGIMEQT